MRKILSDISYILICVLLVLFLTVTAGGAFAAGIAVTAAVAAMCGIRFLCPGLIPKNAEKPIMVIVCATAVTVSYMVLEACLAGVENAFVYMPLCCGSAFLVFLKRRRSVKHTEELRSSLYYSAVFTAVCMLLGIVRELLGMGSIFGISITSGLFAPIRVFAQPTGALILAAVVLAAAGAVSRGGNGDA